MFTSRLRLGGRSDVYLLALLVSKQLDMNQRRDQR
jgi:hypothetical protein